MHVFSELNELNRFLVILILPLNAPDGRMRVEVTYYMLNGPLDTSTI